MDHPAAGCPGRHVCLAIDPFESVLHQTETHLTLHTIHYGARSIAGSERAGTMINLKWLHHLCIQYYII